MPDKALEQMRDDLVADLRAENVDYTDPTDYVWGDGYLLSALEAAAAAAREEERAEIAEQVGGWCCPNPKPCSHMKDILDRARGPK